ncbi:MAG: HDOD domain-containing protein [Burkholderiales bacterium]|nr:HDOD domain-containing protein [Burkholderiales bacterium]
MIEQPLANLDAWVRYFETSTLPVLQKTHDSLIALQASGEGATVQSLAAVAKHDALFALQILRFLQRRRSSHQLTDVTTVERVILMVGVDTLLAEYGQIVTVESLLAGHQPALDAVRRVMQRAHHAALCADKWAAYRHDIDNAEVMTAALLRDIAEILVGCFAPRLYQRIRAMQHADKRLRSPVAQKVVLGFPLIDLQLALIEQWRLPPILKMLMDEGHSEHPRVRTVATAVAFARHVANGWDDAALPDDFKEAAELTGLSENETRKVTLQATERAAESWPWYAAEPNMPPPPPEPLTAEDATEDSGNASSAP